MNPRYIYSEGLIPTQLWLTPDKRWMFDGPCCNGPKRIRENPKGVAWHGEVTVLEAHEIKRAIDRANKELEARKGSR